MLFRRFFSKKDNSFVTVVARETTRG